MKKQTRISRAKLVERAKTAVIVLLFLSCLYLGFQVFEIYREQTTFDGYWQSVPMVVGDAENNAGDVKNAITCFEEISHPEIIVANSNGGRKTIDDKNGNIGILVSGIIRDLYNTESIDISVVQEDEVISALETEWLYIRFPSGRNTYYEALFYNTRNSTILKVAEAYDNMIIASHSADNVAVVYLKDLKSGNWVKAVVKSQNAHDLSELIKHSAETNGEKWFFAHELNLEESLSKGARFDSMLIIPERESNPTITLSVPKLYKAGLSFSRPTDFSIGLANIFRYNPNTIRQYVTAEGALMFVGETGNLGVHPDGLVEYKALDASDGLVVSTSADNNVQEALAGVYGVIEQIQRLSEIQQNERCEIRITKMPDLSANFKKYELGFDYYVNGIKIDFGEQFGVWAVVENGAVVEFKMQVKAIDTEFRNVSGESLSDAIKRYCYENPDYTVITDAKMVYRYLGNEKEMAAEWEIKGVK